MISSPNQSHDMIVGAYLSTGASLKRTMSSVGIIALPSQTL